MQEIIKVTTLVYPQCAGSLHGCRVRAVLKGQKARGKTPQAQPPAPTVSVPLERSRKLKKRSLYVAFRKQIC